MLLQKVKFHFLSCLNFVKFGKNVMFKQMSFSYDKPVYVSHINCLPAEGVLSASSRV